MTALWDQGPAARDQRNFARVDLSGALVRASIFDGATARRALGRVRNASVNGLYVETRAPFERRTPLRVRLILPSGPALELGARVVRAEDRAMAIQLDTHDEDWRFRATFLELAQKSETPPTVEVRRSSRTELLDLEHRAAVLSRLRETWAATLASGRDADHQRFIHACMREGRLEFAVERYRDLERSGSPEAAPYLEHLGRVLSFYALRKTEREPTDRPRPLIAVALAVALVASALLFLHHRLETTGRAEPLPPPMSSVATLAP
jgi:hypothetical protein